MFPYINQVITSYRIDRPQCLRAGHGETAASHMMGFEQQGRCNGAGPVPFWLQGIPSSPRARKAKGRMEVLSPTVWKWSISIQSYSKKCRSCPLKQIGARNSIILSNCLPKSEICQECNVYVPFCNLILWQFSMITFLIRVHPTHIAIIHLALQRDQLPFPWELQGLSTLVLMFFFAPASTGNSNTRKATT